MVISNAYGSDLSLVMRIGSIADRPVNVPNDLDASHTGDIQLREMHLQSSVMQGDALMALLYEQYCNALREPLSSAHGAWVQSASAADHSLDASARHDALEHDDDAAISSLLDDMHTVEEAFGILHASDSIAPANDTPEILALFTPPEHAASSRIPGEFFRPSFRVAIIIRCRSTARCEADASRALTIEASKQIESERK